MNALMDTHTFIWWDSDPTRLSPNALAVLLNPAYTLLLSVVSIWEILIKKQLGKLTLARGIADILNEQRANGLQILPATLDHALLLEVLPAIHRDPFDRLLAAQAKAENAVFVSADPVFAHYPITVIW